MKVSTMRFLDRWLGVPACFVLTRWRKLFRRKPPKEPFDPQRILFIKLAEQGSTVLAYPAVKAAVDRFGRENVYFLLFAENRPVLDFLDVVQPENIISINARGLPRTLVGTLGAIYKLRKAKIDVAIDLEFFARSSAALSYLSGAGWRVGFHPFGGEASYRGDLLTHRLSFNPYLHTSQAFYMMLQALDHPAGQFPTFPQLPTDLSSAANHRFQATSADEARLLAMLREQFGANWQDRLLLLNANASDLMPLRRWPSERYLELARRLLDAFPEICVGFTGAPSEVEAVERIVAQVDSPRCRSLAGKTTFHDLIVLYTLAEVLVTNDSGPAHFATLTPVDVVVLFGPETPKLFASTSPRTHPMWAGLLCSPCINAFNDRNSACKNNVCMQEITVNAVFEKVHAVYRARRCNLARAA